MDSATGIGFTKPLAGRGWSVRKQPTVPIFGATHVLLTWIPSRGRQRPAIPKYSDRSYYHPDCGERDGEELPPTA